MQKFLLDSFAMSVAADPHFILWRPRWVGVRRRLRGGEGGWFGEPEAVWFRKGGMALLCEGCPAFWPFALPHVASSLRLNSAPTDVNTVRVSYQMCTHLDGYYAQQATHATPRSGRWYYMLE